MSGRALSFKQYLGGADNVQMIEMLPEHQKTFSYDFSTDITGWTFSANYSTLVVDELTYNVNTGEPNFATSVVKGYVGASSTVIPVSPNIVVINATSGYVNFTIPQYRYAQTGWIYPDARTNVLISIVEFTWTNTTVTPNVIDSHRWGIIERYTSDNVAGNPTSADNPAVFTNIVIAGA